MIVNTIKAQYGGPPQSSLGYSESYSKRIKVLRPVVEVSALKKIANTSKLAHEFKCVTNEQRRRVKQDILADFKGAFIKIRKDFKDIFVKIRKGFGCDFYVCCTSISYASN
ncbi:hypothetical protein R3W88_019938 [Solanum pinnatisectum]|uniref:Uncharacterized protein n=1 Tax=Solanum pinnatisectum TaxID=50273 RepID=A0AAV9KL39_9SOLN|nr:hypothetical protein R3W88_019938 [Solanum pinnatisectum]